MEDIYTFYADDQLDGTRIIWYNVKKCALDTGGKEDKTDADHPESDH